MHAPEIITPRLRLRPLIEDDAPAMYAYRGDPRVVEFQSFAPSSVGDVEVFIAGVRATKFDTPGTWYQYGISRRETSALVGDVGVHSLADDGRQVEIGFTVAPAWQGQGYGTEAVEGVLGLLFGTLGKHRVFASVDPRNAPSIELLKRVGMRQEAHFRQSLWFKGEWVDDVVFAVLAGEWTERVVRLASR